MDDEPPNKYEDDDDINAEIPKYGQALQRLIDLQIEEEKMKQNPESVLGLPDRPEKKIKEKFRIDRENLERRLNAKGDSLYRSKLEEMHNPWAGAPGVGWGAQKSPPWPGWPAQPQSNSYPGWGGSYDSPAQESPFGRSSQEEENQDENSEDKSVHDNVFGSEPDNKFNSDDEYNSELEKGAEDDEGSEDESMNDEEDLFKKAGRAFAKGESTEFDKEYNVDNQAGESSDEGFGKGPLSSRLQHNDGESDDERYEESTALMEGQEGFMTQESDSEETPSNDQDLDPYGRPKKQLKEKFMKDREELEKIMNAKGDSIYRKASEPPPGAVPPPDGANPPPGGGGIRPPMGYPERRIMGPDELRAQMALQKIARAAFRVAAKRRGRKKGRASVVFI